MLIAALVIAASVSNVEFELGTGIAHSLESDSTNGGYPFATLALQPRVAIDLADRVSIGATFLAIIGGEADNRAATSTSSRGQGAFSATSTVLSVRIHSRQTPQLWAEAGAGIGHLISLQTDSAFEHAPLRSHAGLSLCFAAGARWPVSSRVFLGGELALTRWSNVESGPTGCCGASLSGLSTYAANLLFTATYSLFDR